MPLALCASHKGTSTRWQTPDPGIAEHRAQGTRGVQAGREAREGLGRKREALLRAAPYQNQLYGPAPTQLRSPWLLENSDAAALERHKTQPPLACMPPPNPAPSHLLSVSSVSVYSKVTESPQTSPP